MRRNHLHWAMLNGVLVILAGMLVAGIALTGIVMRDVYHMPIAAGLPGDYRAWMMAHLEGLLNGLMVVVLAGATSFCTMTPRRSAVLFWSLVIMGWGNFIGAVLAPLLGVRGMAYDGDLANNLVTGVFGVAFIGTLSTFFVVTRALINAANE